MANEKKVESKLDLVAAAMAKLDKDFGKGTIMGARDKHQVIDYVSTGSIGLDKALGIGGVPRGRHIEIYGPESSGKTTLAAHIIAEAMKVSNKKCVYVDMEHAIDLKYIEALGVDLDRLLISQPDYGEQALEVVDALVNTGEIDVIVIDSITGLVPKAEIDRDMGDSSMGKQALLMSQALRKLTPSVEKTGTIIIWINQLREKIGVMFGSPETTTGGNAMKFYASVRLDIRKRIINKEDELAISNTVEVKVVKNKVAPPFRSAKFDIVYGEGIDKFKEVLEKGVELNIIEKSGSWYAYEGNKLGQGFDSVKTLFQDNEELYEELKKKVLEKYEYGVEVEKSEEEVKENIDSKLEGVIIASEVVEKENVEDDVKVEVEMGIIN